MTESIATRMKQRLRADLTAAMKLRNSAEATILRDLIAALDNAEAAPAKPESASLVRHDFHARSAEAARLVLDAGQVQAIIRREIDTRTDAVAEFDRVNQPLRADALRAEILVAQRYLDT